MFTTRTEVANLPRPFCRRRVAGEPAAALFKPAGIPARMLEEVVLTLDEFEALRLADLDGLYQEPAAEQMGVSRPTFSRITAEAHRKVADALVHGKLLRIEGGPVHRAGHRCCRWHDGPGGDPRHLGIRHGQGMRDAPAGHERDEP